MHLVQSLQLWDSQKHKASIGWFINFKEQYRTGFKCKDDNLTHERRRTCQKTKKIDAKNKPLLKKVLGNLAFEISFNISPFDPIRRSLTRSFPFYGLVIFVIFI